jgi:hypothetical protein
MVEGIPLLEDIRYIKMMCTRILGKVKRGVPLNNKEDDFAEKIFHSKRKFFDSDDE